MDNSFLAHTLRLNFLAPAMVEAILDGAYPNTISLESLRKPIPLSWREQAAHFGLQIPMA